MIGRGIGWGFATARDALARGLVKLRVTPNMLSVAGMLFTAAAGVCFALGGGSGFGWSLEPHAARTCYPLLAGAFMILASAMDMLDGAVARAGGRGSRFGAFLDSTLDRYSDFAVFAGLAAYYAWGTPANVTFVLLCMLAFFNAFMISYTRARAEDLIESCSVGYWQRGERSAAILIGTFSFNVPAMIVQQAVLPLFTVIRRMRHTATVLQGRTPVTDPRKGGFWLTIRLWRWPRATVPYDLITAANIAWLIFVPIPAFDALRNWLG
ncbi:MAG: CDP-alcohol phosphatidyltransferase family protein [Phycisphaerae bacterium]